jgi:hypothetical protein
MGHLFCTAQDLQRFSRGRDEETIPRDLYIYQSSSEKRISDRVIRLEGFEPAAMKRKREDPSRQMHE